MKNYIEDRKKQLQRREEEKKHPAQIKIDLLCDVAVYKQPSACI